MNRGKVSRRVALLGGATIATGVASKRASAAEAARLDLRSPAERARILTAIYGSTANETVYKFFRLHIYAYRHQGNLEPMFSMSNINISKWQPLQGGTYAVSGYEAGAYTRFDSSELIDHWDNPFTGKRVKMVPFVGGPLKGEMGPNGLVARDGRDLGTRVLTIETLGDTVIMPTAMTRATPNPFSPAEWPDESNETLKYWDSHFVSFAKLQDVADRSKSSVPAHIQFQNLISWQPWFRMGKTPGRTWGRAYGAKIRRIADIPREYLANLEKQTPEIFDIDNWKGPRDEVLEYKKALDKAKRAG